LTAARLSPAPSSTRHPRTNSTASRSPYHRQAPEIPRPGSRSCSTYPRVRRQHPHPGLYSNFGSNRAYREGITRKRSPPMGRQKQRCRRRSLRRIFMSKGQGGCSPRQRFANPSINAGLRRAFPKGRQAHAGCSSSAARDKQSDTRPFLCFLFFFFCCFFFVFFFFAKSSQIGTDSHQQGPKWQSGPRSHRDLLPPAQNCHSNGRWNEPSMRRIISFSVAGRGRFQAQLTG